MLPPPPPDPYHRSVVFFDPWRGASFLVHHLLGLAGCALGLAWNKMALFGVAIEVLFEGTTPLLQALGCMKIAGAGGTRAYAALGLLFAAQFFVFRLLGGGYYLWRLAALVAGPPAAPWWAWAGVAVFGGLSAVNVLWFYKLVGMALARLGGGGKGGPGAAGKAAAGETGGLRPQEASVVKAGAAKRAVLQIRASAVNTAGR